MRPIDRQRPQFKKRRFSVNRRWLRFGLFGVAALTALFVLANVVTGLLYRNKVLPNYSVAGVPVGNIGFDKLNDQVPLEKLLPAEVIIKKDDRTQAIAPADLGVAVDWPSTREHLKQARSWLPVLSFSQKRSVPAELSIDETKFAAAAKGLEEYFTKAPRPERIVFKKDRFVVSPPEDGYNFDSSQLRRVLVGLLEQGKAELSAPTKTTKSTEPTGKLGGELGRLQKQLEATIVLSSSKRARQLGTADMGRFYKASGQTMVLSTAQMNLVVADVAKELGMTAVNPGEAVNAALYAINSEQPVNFRLAPQGTKVHRYCVAARGISTAHLPGFRQKLAAVYGDARGWNQAGIAFVYVESGCDYTAWLSAASRVTDFSSTICDNYYSCRIGRNVIINYDRWKGATDPWNAAGGSLEDYRVMVVNHETGHWLGFGHRNCPGAGQPAPVMQQQSISLQGCKFSPWPSAAEIASL